MNLAGAIAWRICEINVTNRRSRCVLIFARFGRGNIKMQNFESYGVPTFYMTVAIAEPAGGGNVRVWNCCDRSGILIPVCEIIIPAFNLVVAAREVADAALQIFNTESLGPGARH
jgi:hypothetical protein